MPKSDYIANLALTADNTRLRRDLRLAQNQWRNFGTAVGSRIRQLSRVGAVAAAGLGAAFVTASKGVADYADNLAKAARAAGANGQEFQRIVTVFARMGGGAREAQVALQAVSRAVASVSNSTQAKALENIGLSVEQLSRLSPPAALDIIVRQLARIEDLNVRGATALDIFGRRGSGAVLNLAADIRTYTAELRIAQTIPVFTTAQLANAERLNDTIADVGQAIRVGFGQAVLDIGLADRTSAEWAETLATVAETTGNVTTRMIETAQAIGPPIANAVETAWEWRNAIAGVGAAFIALKVGALVVSIAKIATAAVVAARAFIGLARAASLAWLAANPVTAAAAAAALGIGVAAGLGQTSAEAARRLLDQRQQDLQRLVNQIEQRAREGLPSRGLERRAERLQLQISELEETASSAPETRLWEQWATRLREYFGGVGDAIEDLVREPVRGLVVGAGGARRPVPATGGSPAARPGLTADDFAASFREAAEEVGSLEAVRRRELAQRLQFDFAGVGDELRDSLQVSLASAIQGGKWDNVGDALLNSLSTSLANRAAAGLTSIFEPFISGIFDSLQSAVSGVGGGGGGFFSSVFSSLPFFHDGVRRVPGRPGQNVPAVLEAGEEVISADEARRGRGAGMTLVVNVQGNIDEATRRYLDEEMPTVARGVFREFQEQGLS